MLHKNTHVISSLYFFQIKIEALNDSRQIGLCIYNTVVLSAVGLTLTLLLEEEVVRLYAVTSGCIIIGTTATQLIVFIPKVCTCFVACYTHICVLLLAVWCSTISKQICIDPFSD